MEKLPINHIDFEDVPCEVKILNVEIHFLNCDDVIYYAPTFQEEYL